MSRFVLDTPSNLSEDGDDGYAETYDSDTDDLPYPAPLTRHPFLASPFCPSEFLSSLHIRSRHQTLSDLASELRGRMRTIQAELLELVNSHYGEFLSLGEEMKGGEEKVEEVSVGLMGLRRGLEETRGRVVGRRTELEGLIKEREEVRALVAVGRSLLEWERRCKELERGLLIDSTGKTDDGIEEESDESEDDEDEDEPVGVVPLGRLRRHVEMYLSLEHLSKDIGEDHPFLTAQSARMTQAKNTILLDLGTALKQARSTTSPNMMRIMVLMGLYRDLDEAKAALKVIKNEASGKPA